MAITFANVATTDNFSTWLTRTNQMANAFVQVVTVDSNTATGNAAISGTFTANALITNAISSAANLSINSNTSVGLTSKFSVLGDARFAGTIEIDDLTSVTTLTSANATHYFLAANSANGNSLYLSSAPNTFLVNTTFSANVTMSDRLVVTGNVAFSDRLTVSNTFTASNAAVFSNTVTVSGNASFAANVSFAANASFTANVDISERLSVTNAVSFSNTFSVLGTTTLRGISANGGLGTAGQVLTSNGSSTYWSFTGAVSSVGSGDGLTGGPITTTGSLSVLANNGITSNSTGVFVNAQTGLLANSSGLYVNASSIAIGTLAVARGGTGATTFASGSILRGNGASALTAASAADVVAVIGSTNVANSTFALTANVANQIDNQNSASNLKIWTGTAAEYAGIGSKDSNTLYFVSA